MGRPWWYDSYWERDRKPRQRFNLPSRRSWVWIALILVSLILAMNSTGFHPIWIAWLLGFISYLCRILAFTIFIRAILSWFTVSRYNRFVIVLDAITEPVLTPLRRVIHPLDMFDITPLVTMFILYLIPIVLYRLIGFIGL